MQYNTDEEEEEGDDDLYAFAIIFCPNKQGCCPWVYIVCMLDICNARSVSAASTEKT